MTVRYDTVGLFRRELELCKVARSEAIAVLTEDQVRADYAAAVLAAARDLGVEAFQLNLSKRRASDAFTAVGATCLAGNRAAIDALKSADLVIDLVFLLFSAEQNEIMASGTRIVTVLEPLDILERMLPNEDLRQRVEAGEAHLKEAREMRITSPAGTDVVYRLGRYPVMTEYGFSDRPGRWDHWPSGFLFTGAHDDGVDGTVVIGTGDIIYPFKRYVIDPVKLTIAAGRITRVEGRGLDAELMRTYMASYADPKAYHISHIGWGLNERAEWGRLAISASVDAEIGMDGRAFYGNVLFSTGPNTELGGSNNTQCHLDIPLRGCSLFLDGMTIVKDGDIVPPDMRAKTR